MRPFILNNSIRFIRPQSYQPIRPGQYGYRRYGRRPIFVNYNCMNPYCNMNWMDPRSNWDKTMDKIGDVIGLSGLGLNLIGEVLGWFGIGKKGS